MSFDIPRTKTTGIYCVIHKLTGLCYVGSSLNIPKRMRGHFERMRKGSRTRFHVALREFGIEAFDFSVIEECDQSKLLDREKFYISFFNAASLDGLNSRSDPTANYDYVASPVTRARISAAKKGLIRTPEQRAAQSAGQVGLKRSLETRAKISASGKGRVFPPEHRSKIAAYRKGRPLSQETKDAISAGMKGRTFSVETRDKLRQTRLAKYAASKNAVIPYADTRKAVVVTDSDGHLISWYPSVFECAKEHSCPRYYLGIEKPNRDGLWFYYATAIYQPLPLVPA